MTYLVQNDSKKQNMSIHDLSNRFNVSSSYLSKILAKLSKAKLIYIRGW
ncbi:Rrf2 family transcriptional regulator [Enterococcus pseudoavium]|nr:Rrf2 family transcriptional regulator [Enterococcus pseudoavium]